MLDRLSLLVPGWTERSAADLGVVLVELLAYAADNLSYRQDAIANEAYLATARQRVSVRRHARLVDYFMHEGCNARAFVHFDVVGQTVALPSGTQLLTRTPRPAAGGRAGQRRNCAMPSPAGALVFETAHDAVLDDRLQPAVTSTPGATTAAACRAARPAPRCAGILPGCSASATSWCSRRW